MAHEYDGAYLVRCCVCGRIGQLPPDAAVVAEAIAAIGDIPLSFCMRCVAERGAEVGPTPPP